MHNTGIQNLLNLDLNPDDVSRDVENFDNEISNTNRSQQKSWMIDLSLKCPVVGICLNLEEQKKILRKASYPIKNLSAFKKMAVLGHGEIRSSAYWLPPIMGEKRGGENSMG
jgi:hypothetical protein